MYTGEEGGGVRMGTAMYIYLLLYTRVLFKPYIIRYLFFFYLNVFFFWLRLLLLIFIISVRTHGSRRVRPGNRPSTTRSI